LPRSFGAACEPLAKAESDFPGKRRQDSRNPEHRFDPSAAGSSLARVREAPRLSALATGVPTRAGEARGVDLPLRDLFLWVCAIIFFNQLLGAVSELPSVSPWRLLADLADSSVFQIMAWYAIFRLLLSSDSRQRAQAWDILIALALCLPLFLPTTRTMKVLALGAAVFCWRRGRSDPNLRSAGIVLAALTVQMYWGHIVFDLFAVPLLRAETAVVGTLVQAVRAGTEWQGNVITAPSGFSVIVYSACSSFHNLSLAMLCWLTVSRLRNQNWRNRDLLTGCVIGAAMIACNVARICLMSWGPDLYGYWHDGSGAQIFAVGASAMVLGLSLYGSRPASRAL
jgi:exosortase/archaeosortase family protein